MIGPLFALAPFPWPHRFLIILPIALLAYRCVYKRVRRGAGPFPLGSLVFCGSLLLGFVVDQTRGPFVDFAILGLFFGAAIGGVVGLSR